jgi:hypothetical protein
MLVCALSHLTVSAARFRAYALDPVGGNMNQTKRRLVVLTFLLLLMAACSKKSGDATSSAEPAAPGSAAEGTLPTAQPAPAPEPPPPPPPVVIPAGTVLTVRLRQGLGSKTNKVGDRFSATLAEPVLADGKPVVDAGSSASGTVTEAHAAGRFKGGATLGVALRTLTIAGHSYKIRTVPSSLESKGKSKWTAGMIGGGAAGGALIGGIAGGGSGAAIGAVVGAGVGTAGAAFTGKRDINLPAESALAFKMTQPLTLKSESPDPGQPSQP